MTKNLWSDWIFIANKVDVRPYPYPICYPIQFHTKAKSSETSKLFTYVWPWLYDKSFFFVLFWKSIKLYYLSGLIQENKLYYLIRAHDGTNTNVFKANQSPKEWKILPFSYFQVSVLRCICSFSKTPTQEYDNSTYLKTEKTKISSWIKIEIIFYSYFKIFVIS